MIDAADVYDALEIPRTALAMHALSLLDRPAEDGSAAGPVHVFGPSGFGKWELAAELVTFAKAAGREPVEIDLSNSERQSAAHMIETKVIAAAAAALNTAVPAPRLTNSGTSAGQEAAERLVEMCRGQARRPLLLISRAEALLTAEDFIRGFLKEIAARVRLGEISFDLVTFANFPVDLLLVDFVLPKGWRQVALRPFPLPAKRSTLHELFGSAGAVTDPEVADLDRKSRDDVAAWIVRRCQAEESGARLKKITTDTAPALYDAAVQKTSGHPALTVLLLERLLDGLEKGSDLDGLLEAGFAVLGDDMHDLRAKVFPEIVNEIKYSAVLAHKISVCIDELRERRAAGWELLDPTGDSSALRWWSGLGLFVDRNTADVSNWSWAAPFFEQWATPDWLEECRDRLNKHVRQCEAAERERQRQDDAYIEDVQQQVFGYFCDSENGKELGYRLDDTRGTVIVPGLHYRFELQRNVPNETDGNRRNRRGKKPMVRETLHVFRNLMEAGEALWMQHYGVLKRLATLQKSALPKVFYGGRIVDTSSDDSSDRRALGYLLLSIEGQPLVEDYVQVLNELRQPDVTKDRRPAEAVREAVELCEALSLLHAVGIAHRRIDLTSIRFARGEDGLRLTLSGFEFAMVLGAILRDAPGSRDLRAQSHTGINLFFDGPGTLYSRLAFPEQPDRLMTSWLDGDMYAIGVLLSFMFAGPPDEAEVSDILAFLPQGDIGEARLTPACEQFQERKRLFLTDVTRWKQAAQGHPESYAAVLWEIRGLVEKCLSTSRAGSLTSGDLHRAIARLKSDHERALLDHKRRFVAIFDSERMGEKLVEFGLLDGDTKTAEGRGRVRAAIESWLATAEWFNYREEGFVGSGKASDENKREAKYLIVCDQVVFYASYYRINQRSPEHRLLRLSFTAYRNDLRLSVLPGSEHVRVPSNIDVFASDEIHTIPLENYESWEPTLSRVVSVEQRMASSETRLAAATWEFHRRLVVAQERIKQFPVRVSRAGGRAELRLDGERFSDLLKGSGGFISRLFTNTKDRNTFFRDSVEEWQEEVEAGGSKLLFVRQGSRVPKRFDLDVVSIGTDHVVVRDNDLLTETGTLFFTDFYGTQSASARQHDGIAKLVQNSGLLEGLKCPTHGAPALVPISKLCGSNLGPATRQIIQNMKSANRLSALQGPPGTGKTTVVAQLIAELLRDDENLRIFVASQSHSSVDTTMKRVLDTLGEQPDREDDASGDSKSVVDAIRIVPATNADRVSQNLQQWHTATAITSRRLKAMRSKADDYVPQSPDMDRAYAALRRASELSAYELRRRIERSAPLVFGTTAASDTAQDFLREPIRYYDVVIIDEAAKAWGIDLVQPLSVGDRAVMVGDHKQLPPFDNERTYELFQRAKDRYGADRDTIPEDIALVCHTDNYPSALGWLTPFRRLFEKVTNTTGGIGAGQAVPATQTLREQHRSLEPIGRLVSNTFYGGTVETAENLKTIPDRLPLTVSARGKSFAPVLAWIDTSKLEGGGFSTASDGAGKLMNCGEVKIVEKLFAGFESVAAGTANLEERCQILAPYKRQVFELRRAFRRSPERLGAPNAAEVDRFIQTIDSAQGTEADLVVVSMTRSDRIVVPAPGEPAVNWERALRRYFGFLRSSERMNVMFSRARKQLFIVGDFDYFARFDAIAQGWTRTIDHPGERQRQYEMLSFWRRLLETFPDPGDVSGRVMRIDARDILDDGP